MKEYYLMNSEKSTKIFYKRKRRFSREIKIKAEVSQMERRRRSIEMPPAAKTVKMLKSTLTKSKISSHLSITKIKSKWLRKQEHQLVLRYLVNSM
jgi:hypothetical protein